jgi:general secretion pathway protein L
LQTDEQETMAHQLTTALRLPRVFFRWWFSELAGLVPRYFRPSLTSTKACLILRFEGDEIILARQMGRQGETEIGRVADNGVTDIETIGQADFLKSLAERRHRKWPVNVRLASHLGMRKLVDLPLAAKGELDQLLHFELDRLTPFKADDVCFAWRIEETDAKAGTMKVVMEMAPKEIVLRAGQLADMHGRHLDRVELEGPAREGGPLNLLPQDGKNERSGGWINTTLRIATFILLIVAIALPIRKQQAIVEKLEGEITTVRAKAEESLTLRERLTLMSNEANFLADARITRPTMTEVLAELTRLLPDHSHILQLRISETGIDLNGLADKASDLLAILDQSSILTSPKFKSPVTRDQRSGKERFQISVELAERSSDA